MIFKNPSTVLEDITQLCDTDNHSFRCCMELGIQ